MRKFAIPVLLAFSLLSGCGPSGPARGEIHGRVMLDGQPIERGSINFIPMDGTQGPTSGGTIQNGEYHIDAEKGPFPGMHRVEIHARRKTGKQIPMPFGKSGELTDETAEALPSRYHKDSMLIQKVEGGSNLVDFKLDSK